MDVRWLSGSTIRRRLGSLAVVFGLLILGLAVGPASASVTPVSFSGVATYATGGFSFAAAIADLNRDGKPDAVVVNTGSVAVLLGDGSGAFGNPSTYPTGGQFPYSVAVGDLNGDGNPDVVVTNINSNTVSVLLGDGHGGLSAPTVYPTGTAPDLAPTSVAIGDVNGDGKPDLAVANQNARVVSVLLGDGTGHFGPPIENALPFFGSQSVKIADVNRDGKPDLVVGGAGIFVLLGDGTGAFGPPSTVSPGPIGQVYSLAVADLSGDGNPDLLVGSATPGVVVMLGDGAGGFSAPTNYPLAGGLGATLSVGVADLNGDGKPDLLATGGNSDVSVWLGDGTGTFGPSTRFSSCVCSSPNSLAVADLNGDGLPDLVGANDNFDPNTGTGTISVALNTTQLGSDLAITNTAAPNPVVSGTRLTYALNVTNKGPENATGVTVTDPLPDNLHFNSVASTQGSCTRSTTKPAPKDGTITCSIGNLASGHSVNITIIATTTTPGTLTDTATVSGDQPDPDPLNNADTATVSIVGT